MWKLTDIEIRNIVSFRDAKLKINQNVATLIFGRNEDNACQPCNGSGKSALIEAIAFGLTGEQLRKVKSLDEIINDLADDAYVSLTLQNDYDNTTFVIERTISRIAPQVINCHKYDSNGREIETDKTVQPTVLDYNRFILNELGLTKDDIYNNYILCDNKFESFFDCSDKSKKEIINRFSNAILVDEGIERIQSDLEEVNARLKAASDKVTELKGGISAIEQQIQQEELNSKLADEERLKRVSSIEKEIVECRELLTNTEEKKAATESLIATIQQFEESWPERSMQLSLSEAQEEINKFLETHSLQPFPNQTAIIDRYLEQLQGAVNSVAELQKQCVLLESAAQECKKVYDTKVEEYGLKEAAQKNFETEVAGKVGEYNSLIKTLDVKLNDLEFQIENNKKERVRIETKIAQAKVALKGAVTCPRCHHQFLLTENYSIEELETEIKSLTSVLDDLKTQSTQFRDEFDKTDAEIILAEDSIIALDGQKKKKKESLQECYEEMSNLYRVFSDKEREWKTCMSKLQFEENKVDELKSKIESTKSEIGMRVTSFLEDLVRHQQSQLTHHNSNIAHLKGRMKECQKMLHSMQQYNTVDFSQKLKDSLVEYGERLKTAEKTEGEVRAEYEKLKSQEITFNLFKSFLARKKINALSLIVNDFLEKIGSDIRLRLEGFSTTKQGKVRDKISVQVMRDGVDCGSFQKFSGGEKARLNLACILSLHTLTNSNCPEGKGLDFIIIDELLDKSDEVGMATYCDALNRLGQTSLLITQGAVSESYPHTLLIVKNQGISSIR